MTRNTGVLDSEDGRIVALSVQEHSEAGILLPEGRLHAIDTHTHRGENWQNKRTMPGQITKH